MLLSFYKLLSALIIFATTIIAVAYPIKARTLPKHRSFMDLGDAFASGIFLGVALFHMLPEAAEGFAKALPQIHYPIAELYCAAGFILLLFLERLSLSYSSLDHKLTVPYFAAITLIIHSLIEGAALGINTDAATAFILFLAIFVHKGSESFALSMILCRGNYLSGKQLFFIIGIFSLMTPLGIALGTLITSIMEFKQAQLLTAGFNAFAAGTFLYLSTLHHIHHHQHLHESEGILEFFSLLSGLVLMGLVVLFI